MLKNSFTIPLVMVLGSASLFSACGDDTPVTITTSSGSSNVSSTGAGQGGASSSSGEGGATSSSSGQGGAGGGGNSAAIKAACDAFGKALCAKLNECAPFAITVLYGDLAACEARLPAGCPNSASAPGVNAVPDDLNACAAALPAATCDDAAGNNLPAACQNAPGAFKDGAACGDDLQCETLHCQEAMGSHCGVCSPKAAAGGACADNSDCQQALVCSGGNKTCVVPGQMGEACDANQVCLATLACRQATCQPPLKLGDTCNPNIQTSTPECDVAHGHYCDFLSNKCVVLPTAKAGEACGVVGFSFVLCIEGSTCSAQPPQQGTCIAPTPDGGACNAASPTCTTPAQCINGVCTLEDPSTCK